MKRRAKLPGQKSQAVQFLKVFHWLFPQNLVNSVNLWIHLTMALQFPFSISLSEESKIDIMILASSEGTANVWGVSNACLISLLNRCLWIVKEVVY